MKPFSLTAAQLGEIVCTRDERPVVIKAILNSSFTWRIIADVLTEAGTWRTIRFNCHGKEFGHGDSVNDLFMR